MPSSRLLGLLLLGALFAPVLGPPAESQVRIGILTDGPWVRNDEVLGHFRTEILELTEKEFGVRFPKEKVVTGDWTLAGIEAGLDRLLGDDEVDLVLAVGVLSSDLAARRGPLPKPVLAPIVVDPELQGLPRDGGASGVKNLAYFNIPRTLGRDVAFFQEMVPFDTMAVVVNRYIAESRPELGDMVQNVLDSLGVTPVFVPGAASANEILDAIPPGTDAAYVFPLLQFSNLEFDRLIAGLIERRIPSFSFFGEREVQRGLYAGLNPDFFPRLARRVALEVQQILLGQEPGEIPTAFSAGERLWVNLATARAIGVFPSWAILTEAELVDEGPDAAERDWTLIGAMEHAVTSNLDLAAAGYAADASTSARSVAKSLLFPRVDVGALVRGIDEDRARNSFGSAPQRAFSGSASVFQALLNDPVWAQYAIQSHLADAQQEEFEAVRLDIAQAAATAYLNVLRAKTQERIARENVTLTRSNLELARVRETVGQSGPADVARWESRIATNRNLAIGANAERNVAEINFNRILNRPLEEPFRTQDELDPNEDPAILLDLFPYLGYFEDKLSFAAFREFLVQEGIGLSPEVRQIDANLAVAGRLHSSAKREFYLPKIDAFGEINHTFEKGGAGSERISLDPSFDPPDDTEWSVGLNLSYPLFTSGGKIAEVNRAARERDQLETTRVSVIQQVEQRIRFALHRAGASYAGIAQTRLAVNAARRNLEIVTDSYSRGTVPVIDLLDAQTNFILADEEAANAIYNFISDMMEVQRAVGRFDLQMSPEEQEVFLSRLEAFMTERGIRARSR